MIFAAWFASDLIVTEKTFTIEKTSFFIYCFHYLPQLFLKKLSYALFPKTNFYILFNYFAINTLLTLIIVYIAIVILNKFFSTIYAILSGGRVLDNQYTKK